MTERSEPERAEPVALDPLEMLLDAARYAEGSSSKYSNHAWAKAARAAVAKARLAAAGEQKPVAWRWRGVHADGPFSYSEDRPEDHPDYPTEPLYATAPQPAPGGGDRDIDVALAAYNVVWQQTEGIEAKNVDEVRRNAMSAALKAIRSSQSTSDAGGGVRELDASERISSLAADLIVSGWMTSNTQDLEHRKKEAERKLLDFACDEIERHMKRQPALSTPAAADSSDNDAIDAIFWKEKYQQAVAKEKS